jgi:CspA family cold shock protein
MITGKVKFFNKAKGYGFIVRDDNNEEVFVHATGLVDEIHQNDSVSFEVKDGKKGVNAINVKVITG